MPALPAFKKTFLGSSADAGTLARVFVAFVQAVADVVSPLLANPRASSSVQTVSFAAATPKVINHKLSLGAGKTPSGWAITDASAASTFHRTAWDTATITLQASATCSAQLEVW